MRPLLSASLLVALLAGGCSGEILEAMRSAPNGPGGVGGPGSTGGGGGSNPGEVTPPGPVAPALAGITELRRLTSTELDATLSALVGDAKHTALTIMPGEALKPFDNDYQSQLASAVWVEAAERLAQMVTADLLADPARRDALLPCTPAGAQDTACLEKFVRVFGRRALHRPLTDAEVADFTSLHALATERGDFYASMGLVLQRLLQDPEFLFHVEVGTPVTAEAPNTFALSPYEIAARLSFLIQGRTPPDWLLDAADTGALDTTDGVRAAASQLLQAPEGRAHVEVFHAMWLGYLSLPQSAALNLQLVTETTALVRKVVFEQPGDYRTLFTSDQTYVDDSLAQHYGLPATGTSGYHWVSYGTTGRKGILSHGSLLSNGVKQTDTSPTLRGKWIRNRLFCQEIAPPPPNVVADVPPPSTTGVVCKKDRYQVHDSVASCAGCHTQMDPIGFGLEQYDRTGQFRDHEADHPECLISGEGTLAGVGTFTGPSGLADLMLSTGTVESCVVKQLFRFGAGRHELADDAPLLSQLTDRFNASGRRFDVLLLDLVSHPTFSQRRLEVP